MKWQELKSVVGPNRQGESYVERENRCFANYETNAEIEEWMEEEDGERKSRGSSDEERVRQEGESV